MDKTTLDHWLMDLPGVAAGPKWGDDWVYTVADKMFCVICVQGDLEGRISFKVDDHRFLEFTDQPGIEPAPYLARAKWVLIGKPGDFAPDWLRDQVMHSYELVRAKLPKRLRSQLES